MITDYASLMTEIATALPRPDLASNIATSIQMAEAAINRAIRNRQQEQRATATSTEYITFPTDYADIRDIQLNTGGKTKTLEMMSQSQINALGGSTGEPRAFSVIANQIQLAPPPDSAYTVEIVYYKKVPALTGTATTNWFLMAHPDAYFAGAMAYLLAGTSLPQAEAYGSLFAKLMADVNREDKRQKWNGPPMQTRPG